MNRNATKAFSFGLVEVALYRFGANRFAIQSRVIAETEVVTRQFTIVKYKGEEGPVIAEDSSDEPEIAGGGTSSASKLHLRPWWKPVLDMKFDDPEQEAPFWVVTNNAVLNTPFPGIQIKALAIVNSSEAGVFLSGPRLANLAMIEKYIKRERSSLLKELPDGTEINRIPPPSTALLDVSSV